MKIITSLREALYDDRLLGQAIAGQSWEIWRALLLSIMGEPLKPEELELYTLVTGRSSAPSELIEEFWGIMGRRSGKTRAIATLCSYIGTCIDWSDCLAVGERGVLPVLAASTVQASRAFMHIAGVLQNSPDLSEMIDGEPTSDIIRLSSGIDITIHPANFRTIRGITAVAAVCDEIAFWHIDGSKNPDHEIVDALRPSLDTTGGPLLVISSPYARRGELYTTFDTQYGDKGDDIVLVAKGASKTFNPTLKQSRIDRAYARDAAVASAEYGAQFRTDVETFVSIEALEACADNVFERLPDSKHTYVAFVDPSGGSADSFTLAIAHLEDGLGILDVIRERKPPFSPEGVTAEFCAVLKRYGLTEVQGDKYAGEWPREQFRKHGVSYEPSARPKSELYGSLLPLLNSAQVRLLDHPRLTEQLVGLERRTARGGRDSIDHTPGGHDDVANAVAGVLVLVAGDGDGFDAAMWIKLAG